MLIILDLLPNGNYDESVEFLHKIFEIMVKHIQSTNDRKERVILFLLIDIYLFYNHAKHLYSSIDLKLSISRCIETKTES